MASLSCDDADRPSSDAAARLTWPLTSDGRWRRSATLTAQAAEGGAGTDRQGAEASLARGGRFTGPWVDADLEGIVAKRLTDPYKPKLAQWHKILNRDYSQRRGRAE